MQQIKKNIKAFFSPKDIKSDILAGITVSLILIPQSMAYAQLAGLPTYYGLYAALLPPVIAALFGSSNQLSTGPTALASLLTAAALSSLASAPSEVIIIAGTLALLVGLIQLLSGLFKLGVLVNLLSHPVITGFTNAAAIIIATSQLAKLFGVSVPSAEHHYETVLHVLEQAVNHTHVPTLVVGVGTLILIYLLKRLLPKYPYMLIALLAVTIVTWALGYYKTAQAPLTEIRVPELTREIQTYNELYEEKNRLLLIHDALTTQSDNQAAVSETITYYEAEINRFDLELKTTQKNVTSVDLTFDMMSQTYYHSEEIRGEWRISNPTVGLYDTGNLSLIGGGAIIGAIPSGLPSLTIPSISSDSLGKLLSTAAILALLAFAESISIAQAIAAKTKQHIDVNKELVGQGLGNMSAAFTQGYPVAGSFSRSAVSAQAGTKTKLSSIVTGVVVLITLLFFTKLLFHIPQAALAAIIIVAVSGLIQLDAFKHIWQISKHDTVAAALTFFATLYFAPELEYGLAIGIGFSLIYYLYQNTRPRVAFLSKHKDGKLHDSKRFNLAQCENIAVVQFNGPLFFANANLLEEELIKNLAEHKRVKDVLLVGTSIPTIDATGEEKIREIVELLRDAKKEVYFAGFSSPLLEVFQKTGLYDEIGDDNFFHDTSQAVRYLVKHLDSHKDKDNCPLLTYVHQTSPHEQSRLHAITNVLRKFRRIFPVY